MSNSEGEGSGRDILAINQDLGDWLKMKLPRLLIIALIRWNLDKHQDEMVIRSQPSGACNALGYFRGRTHLKASVHPLATASFCWSRAPRPCTEQPTSAERNQSLLWDLSSRCQGSYCHWHMVLCQCWPLAMLYHLNGKTD